MKSIISKQQRTKGFKEAMEHEKNKRRCKGKTKITEGGWGPRSRVSGRYRGNCLVKLPTGNMLRTKVDWNYVLLLCG